MKKVLMIALSVIAGLYLFTGVRARYLKSVAKMEQTNFEIGLVKDYAKAICKVRWRVEPMSDEAIVQRAFLKLVPYGGSDKGAIVLIVASQHQAFPDFQSLKRGQVVEFKCEETSLAPNDPRQPTDILTASDYLRIINVSKD